MEHFEATFRKITFSLKFDSGLQNALLEQKVTFGVQNALGDPKGLPPPGPPARPPSQARGRPGRGWGGRGGGRSAQRGGLQYALLAASAKDGPRSGRGAPPHSYHRRWVMWYSKKSERETSGSGPRV